MSCCITSCMSSCIACNHQGSCSTAVTAALITSDSLVLCLTCESAQKTQESQRMFSRNQVLLCFVSCESVQQTQESPKNGLCVLQATFGESMTRMFVGTCALWLPCLPLFWFMRKAVNSRTNTKSVHRPSVCPSVCLSVFSQAISHLPETRCGCLLVFVLIHEEGIQQQNQHLVSLFPLSVCSHTTLHLPKFCCAVKRLCSTATFFWLPD